MFRKMPFILCAVIIAVLALAPYMPFMMKQIVYSISLSMKSVIVFILPCIIFGLLFKTVVKLSHDATKIIGMILLLVICSNFISTFLSHFVGIGIYHLDLTMMTPSESSDLLPLWTLDLPKLISNDKAMFSGIILGFILSKLMPFQAEILGKKIDQIIGMILQMIVSVIPIFVAGFIVKLQVDGLISVILKDYSVIFMLITLTLIAYIGAVYLCLTSCKGKLFVTYLKNMFPAGMSGFSTMSSAASMPLTLIGAENNAQNKAIVRAVIPATVNIHLVGDCFAIPIFAYAVLKSFGMAEPSFLAYLIFSFYFVLAKFSVAAIPGGGIIVMLPILETYLGFNSEMMSLITALYILFDPVITCANVMGNGAFSKLLDVFVQRFGFIARNAC